MTTADDLLRGDDFSVSEDENSDVEIEAMDDEDEDDEDSEDGGGPTEGMDAEGVVAQLIDIREPLTNLRKALERRLGMDLVAHEFWLQDSQRLPENTTLVEQCVQGEGMVQINVEIRDGKINIVDVLKPADEGGSAGEDDPPSSPNRPSSPRTDEDEKDGSAQQQETVTRWVVCAAFRKEQQRLDIPTDPAQWSQNHVSHWIKWTIREFPKASISLPDWDLDGKELCAMSHEDFKRKVPIDPNDLMWTHLQLLRQCKFVAVVQKDTVQPSSQQQQQQGKRSGSKYVEKALLPGGTTASSAANRKTNKKPPVRLGAAKFTVMSESALGNRTGNNGQVQLWQFLLELLTEKDLREVIHWIGDEGEFKLENPEVVAQLWGNRKNKPSMNYEKLSRALRYYYDGDMISKVHGKRFVYKFVCDLKQLIGYSAAELNTLVIEAEQRSLGKNLFKSD